MATTYAELDDLKLMRSIETDEFDGALNRVLDRASRRIDNRCDRVFYPSEEATPRVFETGTRIVRRRNQPGELLLIDDIHKQQDLLVEVGDGFEWTVLDSNLYLLDPVNPDIGWPWEGLRLRRWATWRRTSHVRVTAFWGWAATPGPISEATLLLANRLYLRKDSPEGVGGSAEWGTFNLQALDPDVEDLIGPYIDEAPGG